VEDVNMKSKHTVKLSTLVAEHELEIIRVSRGYDTALIDSVDINRPGLQLTGYYEFFDRRDIQIIGIVETAYLSGIGHAERLKRFEEFMSRHPSAVVICEEQPILPECLEMAEKYDINLFKDDLPATEFAAQLIGTLRRYLAPRVTRHGVLIEVHGEGLLIMGESGIGKSETAIELIKRGHRLIADDAVEIYRINRKVLSGMAPELIRYYMELRGIGVIDVRRIYGVGAVKPFCDIDLIVNLEAWDENAHYDRLGIESESMEILGVTVPSTTIPVRPGRNLAVIMEVAAINNRQKKMGFNAALQLAENHDRMVNGI